jgi:hypothetical protein
LFVSAQQSCCAHPFERLPCEQIFCTTCRDVRANEKRTDEQIESRRWALRESRPLAVDKGRNLWDAQVFANSRRCVTGAPQQFANGGEVRWQGSLNRNQYNFLSAGNPMTYVPDSQTIYFRIIALTTTIMMAIKRIPPSTRKGSSFDGAFTSGAGGATGACAGG